MGEKFFNIFGLIFINSQMAKLLGAESFGKIAFAASLFAFIQVLSQFGSNSILLKRMSENPKSGLKLAYASQKFKILVLISSSFFTLLYLFIYGDEITLFFGFINLICSYFVVLDFFSIYNNSQLNSKINAVANVIGLLLSLLCRYLLIKLNSSIYWFGLPLVIFAFIPYFIKMYYFNKNLNLSIYLNKKHKNHYIKYMKTSGGNLVVAAISVTIYSQISNIFLAKLVSFKELGIFNIAMTLGLSWNFILNSIGSSYFSKIYSLKSLDESIYHFKKLSIICLFIGFIVFIIYYLFSEFFVIFLYGDSFIEVLNVLPIIVMGATISALGTNHYRLLVKYNGYSYLTKKMIMVSIISIPLSYILISKYEIIGAAYCFLIIEILSITFFNYFFRNGLIFKIHTSMFNLNSKRKFEN